MPRLATARPGVQARAVFFAVALIEGADSPEARAWLREGLRAWRREGGELLAHLHLPPAHRFRLACRDLWLADAARYCAGTPLAASARARARSGALPRFQVARLATPGGGTGRRAARRLVVRVHRASRIAAHGTCDLSRDR